MKTRYMNRLLIVAAIFLVYLTGCNDDEGVQPPSIVVESETYTVKPDSSVTFTVTGISELMLGDNWFSAEVSSGSGSVGFTDLTGVGEVLGTTLVTYTAGNTANESSVILLTLTDSEGRQATEQVQVDITDLDFPSALIINEGNFQAGNGSIFSLDIKTEEVTQGLFDANATIQNAIEFNDQYYVVSNSPDKLDILAKSDLSEVNSITTGFNNPIGFAAVGDQGFVTNWGTFNLETFVFENSFITVIDLTTAEVVDSIELTVKPQEILALNGLLYVAMEGDSYVLEIDPSDLSMEEIATPAGPSIMVVDEDQDLWALCTSGNLVEIDPEAKTITNTLEGLTTSGFDEKMAISSAGDVVYFLGGGNDSFTGQTNVFKVDLSASTLAAEALVTDGFALYAIAVNPETGYVYVGDNNAFQSTGTGFIYDEIGTELSTFATGVGPNNFIFK